MITMILYSYMFIGLVITLSLLCFDLMEIDGLPSETKKTYKEDGIMQVLFTVLISSISYPVFIYMTFFKEHK